MLTVDIQHKSHAFGRDLINGLNFTVAKGDQVAIVGPSGAGKSTLLNIIVGLDNAFVGSVKTSQADERITMMFQEPRLMPWLTVLENVALVGEEGGARERAEDLLQAVGMIEEANYYPNQLSGGMKKRVALARAFMPKPSLLLMDEPFASLDAPTAVALRELVCELCAARGVTLMCVTHDLSEAVTLANRVLFFSKDPMNLILDKSLVSLKAANSQADTINHCCQALLAEHPNILKGIA